MLDSDLQKGSGIYPGEDWCNPQEPHAKVAFVNINICISSNSISVNIPICMLTQLQLHFSLWPQNE